VRALRLLLPLALLLGACGGGGGLISDLEDGGYVLVLRHAQADPSEEGQRERLGSCTQQRNLTAAGREQARAIGAAIRERGIPIGEVLASPMCRTRDTAELAFGRATVDRRLLSPGVVGTIEDDERRARELREMVNAEPPAGTNTVLVTHTGNIGAALGKSVDEGGMLVYRAGRLEGTIEPDDWVDQPKKTSAVSYSRGSSSFGSASASSSGTRTMSVPRSATIFPKSPSLTASIAATPKRVPSTRS
jgi:broad specificity phosphatase PhoE